jgi:Spy/CpxP family protein refolding chaperone
MQLNYKRITAALALSLGLTGVVALAQTAARRHNPAERQQRRLEMLTSRLNLTADQQEKAKSLFESSRAEARPLMRQTWQSRAALRDATRAGKSDDELKQLANRQGELMGQMAAIHARTQAQFRALLTPEQQQKSDELAQHMRARFGEHRRPRSDK